MNLHALRIFTKVAALKSVTKAADALLISQPAVTIQIRNLEEETGLKLVETSGRGIKLTPQGEFLFSHGQRLFHLEADIEKKVEQLKAGVFEELNISSTYLPANYLLPTLLSRFKQENPSLSINLFSGNSSRVINALLHFQTDLAFVVQEENKYPEITRIHLLDLEYWFIVPKGHKYNRRVVELAELIKEPFILREEGSSTREILFSLCKIHGLELSNIGLQFQGLNESIRSVVAGYGVMLAPSIAVKDHLSRNEVGRVLIKDVDIRRPVYLCTRNGDLKNNWVEKFIEFVKDHLHLVY
jgi:DNA-binding transcriptional LysR family regulator